MAAARELGAVAPLRAFVGGRGGINVRRRSAHVSNFLSPALVVGRVLLGPVLAVRVCDYPSGVGEVSSELERSRSGNLIVLIVENRMQGWGILSSESSVGAGVMRRASYGKQREARFVGSIALVMLAGCANWLPGEVDELIDESDVDEQTVVFRQMGDPSGTSGAALTCEADAEGRLDWQSSLGAADESVASGGVASDAEGNVLVAGRAQSLVDGEPSADTSAIVAKYAADGSVLWTQRLGTAGADAASGVGVDASGNVLVAGTTSGALAGAALGFDDGFAVKYSPSGALEWSAQLGTSEPDAASSVGAGADGTVFVVGQTRGVLDGTRAGSDFDAFVVALSAAGEPLWQRQLGSDTGFDELAAGVSVSGDGVVLAGRTFGALAGENGGSADAFVAKYSTAGELVWARQLGGPDFDAAEAVSVDASGEVYVAGQAGGFLAGPGVVIGSAPFLAKYSAAGELLWRRDLAEASMGAATSVSADASGNVFIAGYTSAAFGGQNQGVFDAFLAKYSPDGGELWVVQPGLAASDRATGVSTDACGNVAIAQSATSTGGLDTAFVARFR